MAHQKQVFVEDILKTAVGMIEAHGAGGLSLRAVASSLGVKAPSLYRYFEDKEALEFAIFEEILRRMHTGIEVASAGKEPKAQFIRMANAFVAFARQHPGLYAYVSQERLRAHYGSDQGKAIWNTMLRIVSAVSGRSDDTASTVAIWSFLHGYAALERFGAFGASGPKGGFQMGIDAFLAFLGPRSTATRASTGA